ncbi:uncharacterized protein LOC123311179 [Coccinella septempunctata]|uniref:uncharacterized protein LOC123311179 n=1 Tax=Coccinella septempunctata TaxID=41139 RepID=UPI001D081951|nr:uncharacterized protein LOC123311179 [Coccinella septempunctata]XP_044750924.1 uncharacterized protein LOC123311179 [Coccinella septempunctata]
MNKSEETIITVEPNIILMENIEYIMENITHFEMAPRIEDVFTSSELRCGRAVGNSFSFVNFSQNTDINNKNAMEVATNSSTDTESKIPTFEINDSDEDVIFVAEYNKENVQNDSEETYIVPYSCLIPREDDTSSSTTSSDASPGIIRSNGPRRNPTRNARNKKYKKKCSEYITEEDLNVLMASDDDSANIDKVDEALPCSKEIRPKKVVVNNWPAEGLHERPEYNEQTEEIEKFDFSIRQIQNCAKKVKTEKAKNLKTQKKKYVPKKFNYRTKKNKNTVKRKEVETVPFSELSGLINDTFDHLLQTFIKTVKDSKVKNLHVCSKGKDSHNLCLNSYDELLMNQSRLLLLNEEIDFEDINNKLKNEIDIFRN